MTNSRPNAAPDLNGSKESDKRARILEAARTILAAKRYDDVPVSEIVEAAGVAKGTFYLYFPSKADLIAAVAEGMQQEVQKAIFSVMNDDQPIIEVIEAVIWAVYRTLQQHRDLIHVIEMDLLLGGKDRHMTAHNQQVIGTTAMLERARNRGEIDPDLDPRITAELVSGVMMPLAQAMMFGQAEASPERYIAETIAFLRRALGVRKAPN
jgi:TetR/AcrR family transcriptional regulator, fatty acid metabolism regulator protein